MECCVNCRSIRRMEPPTVNVAQFPQVIHVRCVNQSEGKPVVGGTVARTLTLRTETFDLVGWIEHISALQFVGHVVVDQYVHRSDGGRCALRCSSSGECGIYGTSRVD